MEIVALESALALLVVTMMVVETKSRTGDIGYVGYGWCVDLPDGTSGKQGRPVTGLPRAPENEHSTTSGIEPLSAGSSHGVRAV
jgi:hypothetical protein